MVLAALVLAGCGADDEQGSGATATGTGTQETTTGGDTTKPESARSEGGSTTGSPPPPAGDLGEEQPTGVGAAFVGRSGRVGPKVVRVPPFVAPRARLVSSDGGSYGIRVEGKTLTADAAERTASVELPGLQPGSSYAVEVVEGAGGPLRIEASSEPE